MSFFFLSNNPFPPLLAPNKIFNDFTVRHAFRLRLSISMPFKTGRLNRQKKVDAMSGCVQSKIECPEAECDHRQETKVCRTADVVISVQARVISSSRSPYR